MTTKRGTRESIRSPQKTDVITALQCKMARAALGWNIHALEEASGVGYSTISTFENGHIPKPETLARLRSAFEAKGVVFIDENGGGAGVRAPKAKKKR